MLTWGAWIKLMRSLEPHDRAKCLLGAGFAFLCFLPIFIYNLNIKVEPIAAPWVRLPASLASDVEPWEYDKSIYTVSIYYNAASGRRTKAPIYIYRSRYDAANISKSTPLFVEIEDTLSGPIARTLSTKDEILSNPALRQRVNEASDRKAVEGIVFFCTLSLLSFAGAAVIHWQNLRNKRQQGAIAT